MFTDCPYCGFLVALDADGQPLARCPNCAQRLRGDGDDAAGQDAKTVPTEGEDRMQGPGDAPAEEASTDVAAAANRTGTHDTMQAPTEGSELHGPAAALARNDAPVDPRPEAADRPNPASARDDDLSADAAGPQSSDARDPQPLPDEPAATAATDAPAIGATASIPAAAAIDPRTTDDASRPASSAAEAGHGSAAAPTPASGDAPPADTAPDAPGDPLAEAPQGDHQPAPTEASTPAAQPARARPASAAPSFVRGARSAPVASRRRRALEAGALLALCALLAVQLLVADRARLAGDARWRPLVSTLCGTLRCALPAWREPAAFRVVERDVRARSAGVLRVSARIRNEARWSQPWPALQLTLSDAHGREVATRIFQPREYLGGTPTQSGLASGQDAALSMDIVEPGPHAVAFTFDFL